MVEMIWKWRTLCLVCQRNVVSKKAKTSSFFSCLLFSLNAIKVENLQKNSRKETYSYFHNVILHFEKRKTCHQNIFTELNQKIEKTSGFAFAPLKVEKIHRKLFPFLLHFTQFTLISVYHCSVGSYFRCCCYCGSKCIKM